MPAPAKSKAVATVKLNEIEDVKESQPASASQAADVALSQQQINTTWYDAADGLAAVNGRITTTDFKVDALHDKVEHVLRLVQQIMGTTASKSTSMQHTRDQGSGCARAR